MSFESHGAAINIEHTICKILNCDRFGFGGYADADFIESNPIEPYLIGLAAIYANSAKKKEIDNFLEKIGEFQGKNIVEIGIDTIHQLTEEFRSLL
ncbi:hypothetical protein [Clostridium tyrobutyricum]|uniref:hypothetical protein n=1 Tax=Clostridium tyrobutyricum TaxID=1519 RepID=UPI00057DF567|nr:hypothetical protein [Clostridium tyrobutyricum]